MLVWKVRKHKCRLISSAGTSSPTYFEHCTNNGRYLNLKTSVKLWRQKSSSLLCDKARSKSDATQVKTLTYFLITQRCCCSLAFRSAVQAAPPSVHLAAPPSVRLAAPPSVRLVAPRSTARGAPPWVAGSSRIGSRAGGGGGRSDPRPVAPDCRVSDAGSAQSPGGRPWRPPDPSPGAMSRYRRGCADSARPGPGVAYARRHLTHRGVHRLMAVTCTYSRGLRGNYNRTTDRENYADYFPF